MAVLSVALAGAGRGRPLVAVRATTLDAGEGRVDLEIEWRWLGWPEGWWARWRRWLTAPCPGAAGEAVLAVSFDTHTFAYLGDDAPGARGADGCHLRLLEAVLGPDGARRVYGIPAGRSGRLRVAFVATDPAGRVPSGAAFRVDLVHGAGGEGWLVSQVVAAP